MNFLRPLKILRFASIGLPHSHAKPRRTSETIGYSGAMARTRKRDAAADNVDLPDFIAPMLAEPAEPFDSTDFLFEIKWDGTRAVVLNGRERLRIANRRKVQLLRRYPEFQALEALPPGTALDGEIIVLDDGKPAFNKLMQREHLTDDRSIAMAAQRLPATLIAFDLMYADFASLMDRPLLERKQRLAKVVEALHCPHLLYCDHVLEHGRQYFAAAEAMGLEGVMGKRVQSRYQPGQRGGDWLKIKATRTETFEVIGFTQRDAQPIISALVIGRQIDGAWFFDAKVGSGFTEHQRAAFFSALHGLPALDGPPADGPPEAHWRATGLRCRVRYAERTAGGKLRSPVFLGLVDSQATPS